MNITGNQNAPYRALAYASPLDSLAFQYGLDPALVAAIGDRETLWGTSSSLDMKGSKGTGDFTPRNPQRWGGAMPPDGRGWGRGLMQIDFGGHRDWCMQKSPDGRFLWEIPEENIRQGCRILHANFTTFTNASFQKYAAICAYNAGAGTAMRVLGQLAGKSPSDQDALQALDGVTTGKNYVSDVLRREAGYSGLCV